jgi:rhomboid protease GluP
VKQVLTQGKTKQEETQTIEEIIANKEKEYELHFQVKTPIVTYCLIGINILVAALIFLYSLYSGVSYSELLMTFGAKENSHILSGEYWRFITPIFLHGGLLHLLINCYSLYVVGILVERLFGRSRFLAIYLISGIFGNIASFMFSINPGVGASGAIFGLLGTLLFFAIYRPTLFRVYFGSGVITTIIINLAYGFSNAGIDNFAHIGGLIGGFIASGIVSKTEKKQWYLNRGLYILLALIIAFSGLYYGFNSKQNKMVLMLNELDKMQTAENWQEAELKAEEILELKPKNVNIQALAWRYLTTARVMSGNYDEAEESAKELIKIDPKDGHYVLGVVYLGKQQYDAAKEELLEARKAGNNDKRIQQMLDEIDKAENNSK